VNKILLTGSTGFIGSELLRGLSQKNIIFITLRNKNKFYPKNKNIRIIYFKKYNQLNSSLKKLSIDTVIHCASHYVKHHNYEDIIKLSDSNITFGNIILDNLDKMKVKKFINFSTGWVNYNGKKNNCFNLYSTYKKNFNEIINFYKKKFKKIKFFNLVLLDTFGENDKRKKIISLLKTNYKKNKSTTIISKRLSLNLLNILDIQNAINLILQKKIEPDTYVLKNKINYSMLDIVNKINKESSKKIKIKWLSNKILKEKIYNYKQIKKWRPINSKIQDIVDLIKK
jgi:nucleoside-diphosphate-sugar epimerase